jgi:transposase
MASYVEGIDRGQVTLFSDRLEDFAGVPHARPASTGRPDHHPSMLLKLYVCGHLNRTASSRRLEREAARNVDLMWPTGRPALDHKTIADFRRDNGSAIKGVCGRFILLCCRMGLLGGAVVAIDGSKFKALNNRGQNFTPAKMQRRLAEIEAAIGRYMAEMDGADAADPGGEARVKHLHQKLAALHACMTELKLVDEQLRTAPDGQVSLVNPDVRSMNARVRWSPG